MTHAKARDLFLKRTAGLTLAAVAEKIGTSITFVSYLRRGMKRPGLAVALRIEKVYGISAALWTRKKAA